MVPFTTYMLRNFFISIPSSMTEAAIMDGAGHFQTFTAVILPLSVPALITACVVNVVWVWNELLIALVFLQSESLRTLIVGITVFKNRFTLNVPVIMAGPHDRHGADDRVLRLRTTVPGAGPPGRRNQRVAKREERDMLPTTVGFVEVACTPHVEGLDGQGRPMRRDDLAVEAIDYLRRQGYTVIPLPGRTNAFTLSMARGTPGRSSPHRRPTRW